MRRILPLTLVVLAGGCTPAAPAPTAGPATVVAGPSHVLMVSFDGMRYDMVDRVPTPAFDEVARKGVRAAGLIPGYPTNTFPNHYSLATGLYPANHGLVDNSFYDPRLDALYRLGDSEAVRDGRWYGGEPIWVTAETQGVTTASFFWVGTEAEIDGVRPSYYKYYDGSVPYAARVDTVLHWLSLPPDQRPRLVMLYFSEPDHTAHEMGPDDPAVDSVVREMDALLGRLTRGLAALPIADQVSLVLVSDHGMALAPQDQVLYLDDAVDLEGIRMVGNTTQALLYFGEDTARIPGVQAAINQHFDHATAYRPHETPERWHYSGNPRIGDLVVAADPGWVLRLRDWRPWSGGGTHGWDPYHRAMHGIFFAAGPTIEPGTRIPAFENVHVHPLLAHLLGIRPAPGIDGRLERLEGVLREASRP